MRIQSLVMETALLLLLLEAEPVVAAVGTATAVDAVPGITPVLPRGSAVAAAAAVPDTVYV